SSESDAITFSVVATTPSPAPAIKKSNVVLLNPSPTPETSATVINPPSTLTQFAIGDRVQVRAETPYLNIRSNPTGSRQIVGTQVAGALGTIIAGPVYYDPAKASYWNV